MVRPFLINMHDNRTYTVIDRLNESRSGLNELYIELNKAKISTDSHMTNKFL